MLRQQQQKTNKTKTTMSELRDYYAFDGSLTTPPCSPGARFYLAKGRKQASRAQVEAAVSPAGEENARPLQDRGRRTIWEG